MRGGIISSMMKLKRDKISSITNTPREKLSALNDLPLLLVVNSFENRNSHIIAIKLGSER